MGSESLLTETSGYQRVFITACAVRKLLITQKGRLSLDLAATSKGDLVCGILLSSPVLTVLSPRTTCSAHNSVPSTSSYDGVCPQPSWRFLGDAYVHRMMIYDGLEFRDDVLRGNIALRDFFLCS